MVWFGQVTPSGSVPFSQGYAVIVVVLSLIVSLSYVPEISAQKGANKALKASLEQFAHSLIPETDYNVTMWAITAHSRSPSDYFDRYSVRISNIFKQNQAFVNFVSVGACDGTTDPIIKDRFLKNEHWRAVFVEPMTPNVRDLEKFIDSKGALGRSHIIQAAATDVCTTPTIKVERPLYEEKAIAENKTIPHWLRRQIGSIVPANRDHARPEWTLEEVACVTAADVIDRWTAAQNKIEEQAGKRKKTKRMRPPVLKIDVEGHDYEVCLLDGLGAL
jgi:hypothetical protein